MYTFLGMTEDVERMARRIRRLLGTRPAVHVDELRMRLGMDKTTLREALKAMVARGEVERLRPIDFSGEDHDFYRVHRPVAMWVKAAERRPEPLAQNGPEHVRLSGLAVAWLSD